MIWALLCSLLVALCTAVPTQFTYIVGRNYVYNLTGNVQNQEFDTVQEEFTSGFYSNVQATMVLRPIKEDSENYYFAMNLYDTVVSLSDQSPEFTPEETSSVEDPGSSLGADVYFTQKKTGEIISIEYDDEDPLDYINVKVGAINAFQTSFVSPGTHKRLVESDPVGTHLSKVSSSLGEDGVLYLSKECDQDDFTAFSDSSVSDENMQVQIEHVTGIHPEGYIVSAETEQLSMFLNPQPQTMGVRSTVTNTSGFDSALTARGFLTITFVESHQLLAKTFVSKEGRSYVSEGLFAFGKKTSSKSKISAATIADIKVALEAILSKEPIKLVELTKIGTHFMYHPKDLIILEALFKSGILKDFTLRDRLFFIATVAQADYLLEKYGLESDDCEVVMRAVLAAPHFAPSQKLVQHLERISENEICPVAQNAAYSVLSTASSLKGPSFPFSKTFSKSVKVGGGVADVTFNADLYAGSNFNCKQPTFSFEAHATSSATASLFGMHKSAFDAQVVYGQQGGAPLANSITLSVWGKQIYNKPLPYANCRSGNYPLAHASPGFRASYTLWVSVVPITFSASASLNLHLGWGWNVCPSEMTASVNLRGDGAIELAGSAHVSLLLVKAGLEISGSFNTALIPEAYIKGSMCTLGIQLTNENIPMRAAISTYYQWRHCKWFRCGWGTKHQQVWWHWDAAPKTSILFKQEYKIAK